MTRSSFLSLLLPSAALAQQARPRFTPEQIHRYEREDTAIPDFSADGLILDLGGGGEGVIAQMKGAQVVAIDLSARELADAPGKPLLKILMDATDLKFLDASFSTLTCFYTLMFIPVDKQLKVLEEARRVLTPGGRLLIWDVEIPPAPSPEEKVGIFYFNFLLPSATVRTGYGTLYGDTTRGPAHYEALARRAGFEIRARRTQGRSFFLELLNA